jgi:hypothetical protein
MRTRQRMRPSPGLQVDLIGSTYTGSDSWGAFGVLVGHWVRAGPTPCQLPYIHERAQTTGSLRAGSA